MVHADVMMNPDGTSKGWGVVQYASSQDAVNAIQVRVLSLGRVAATLWGGGRCLLCAPACGEWQRCCLQHPPGHPLTEAWACAPCARTYVRQPSKRAGRLRKKE